MVKMISDKGMVRSLNEDYAKFLESEDFNVYVVADGMGGHNAGEVASRMAVEGIIEYISINFLKEEHLEILKRAIEKVNVDIYNYSKEKQECHGMGTTVTACLEIEDKVIVANVGDSSSFVIRGNDIIKITKDHSLVQELLDLGTISEVEAANHSKKNIITRAVGTNESVAVDIFTLEKNQSDLYMLCSDGLTNELTKDEIISAIRNNGSLENTCDKLVNIANNNGGRDNITVLLFGGER